MVASGELAATVALGDADAPLEHPAPTATIATEARIALDPNGRDMRADLQEWAPSSEGRQGSLRHLVAIGSPVAAADLAPRTGPRRNPRERSVPAGIEHSTWAVEVDRDRRVVGRNRRALASLAIDLGPHHALRDRRRREQQGDPPPLVAGEVAGAGVPPPEPPPSGLDEAERGAEGPGPRVCHRRARGLGG